MECFCKLTHSTSPFGAHYARQCVTAGERMVKIKGPCPLKELQSLLQDGHTTEAWGKKKSMAIYNSFRKIICRILQGTVNCLEGRINILSQTRYWIEKDFVITLVTELGRHTTLLFIQYQILPGATLEVEQNIKEFLKRECFVK